MEESMDMYSKRKKEKEETQKRENNKKKQKNKKKKNKEKKMYTIERARRLERASLRRSSMEESMDMYLSLSLRMRSILYASIERSHAANERPSVCV